MTTPAYFAAMEVAVSIVITLSWIYVLLEIFLISYLRDNFPELYNSMGTPRARLFFPSWVNLKMAFDFVLFRKFAKYNFPTNARLSFEVAFLSVLGLMLSWFFGMVVVLFG